MKKYLFTIIAAMMSVIVIAQDQVPAFPGAEGHGRYTTGGRKTDGSTTIVHVTNLNDSGTGSFRAAVTGGTYRTIVFDVAGVIALRSDLKFKDHITVLGQTAPYPGITVRYYTVQPGADNIIASARLGERTAHSPLTRRLRALISISNRETGNERRKPCQY